MQLTDGICEIKRIVNVAEAGEEPRREAQAYIDSWYATLDCATSNAPETGVQGTEVETRRIRVLDDERIMLGQLVTLNDRDYSITRIFRGSDSDNGMRICDLTLEGAAYDTII
ncbi:MAG: hypothetical protein Q4C04_04425 [Clostridia bacterium]|nr:hypothetical protein [Clostridia bacterium]